MIRFWKLGLNKTQCNINLTISFYLQKTVDIRAFAFRQVAHIPVP